MRSGVSLALKTNSSVLLIPGEGGSVLSKIATLRPGDIPAARIIKLQMQKTAFMYKIGFVVKIGQ